MEQQIFSGYGVLILRRDGRLYISYDSGGSVSCIKEDEITEEEAQEAMKSEEGAYRVLLKCEKREKRT